MFNKREDAQMGEREITDGKEGQINERERDELIAGWQRDAEQLKLIIPEFDLSSALKNEAFASELKNGATIFEAYAKTSKMPKKEPREEIEQNARGARRGTGTGTINPAKLSDDEFRKYINNIKNI